MSIKVKITSQQELTSITLEITLEAEDLLNIPDRSHSTKIHFRNHGDFLTINNARSPA